MNDDYTVISKKSLVKMFITQIKAQNPNLNLEGFDIKVVLKDGTKCSDFKALEIGCNLE